MEPAHVSADDFVFKQQIQPLTFTSNSRSKRTKTHLITTPHLAKKRFKGTNVQDAGHQISRRSITSDTQQQFIEPIDMTNLLPLLKKHVVYIDTTIWNQDQLHQLAEGMGAKVQPRLDKSVGVYIIDPKESERLHKTASRASMNGIKCVSPNWIMTCYKEKKYHPPMNFPYELGSKSTNSHHYKLHLEAPSSSLSTTGDSNGGDGSGVAGTTTTTYESPTTTKECDNPFGDEEIDFDYLEENQPGMQRTMDRYITRTNIPSLNSSKGTSLYYSAAQQIDHESQQNSSNSSSYIPIGNLTVSSEVDEVSQQQQQRRSVDDEPSQARREYFYNQSSRKESFVSSSISSGATTTTAARRANKLKQILTPEQQAESKRILEETQKQLDALEAANKKQKVAEAAKQLSISKNTRSNTQERKKRANDPDAPSFGDGRMRIWYGNTKLDDTVPIEPYPATTTTTTRKTAAAATNGSSTSGLLKRSR